MIKFGNKMKPKVRPALQSAITQHNMNKIYLTSSFVPRGNVIKNACSLKSLSAEINKNILGNAAV